MLLPMIEGINQKPVEHFETLRAKPKWILAKMNLFFFSFIDVNLRLYDPTKINKIQPFFFKKNFACH